MNLDDFLRYAKELEPKKKRIVPEYVPFRGSGLVPIGACTAVHESLHLEDLQEQVRWYDWSRGLQGQAYGTTWNKK